ncbi:MAG: VanZ family protein [Saprospiraceae bacterium]|nr:VanZ family protein [Saprospiraceae bacterium]
MTLKPFLPAIFWLAIVTYLSVTSKLQVPKFQLFAADKIGHAAAYALLVWLLAWSVWKSKNRALTRGEMFILFCFAAAYGALMEWVQGTFFPNRFFEFDDMLANAAGAFLALIFVKPLSKILGPKASV